MTDSFQIPLAWIIPKMHYTECWNSYSSHRKCPSPHFMTITTAQDSLVMKNILSPAPHTHWPFWTLLCILYVICVLYFGSLFYFCSNYILWEYEWSICLIIRDMLKTDDSPPHCKYCAHCKWCLQCTEHHIHFLNGIIVRIVGDWTMK